MRRRLRSIGRAFHSLVVIGAVVTLAVSGYALAILIFQPHRAEELTSGVSPRQFFKLIDADVLDSYEDVFGVAHNAGDSLDATRAALDHGADVIEIDVVSLDNRLFAAHDTPQRWFSSYVFRGPSLEQVWRETASAAAVYLDLKESSPAFIDRVAVFLQTHRDERSVIIASPDPAILKEFSERVPEVYRFLSVSTQARLTALQEVPARRIGIAGVSIRASLLDRDVVEWLADEKLLVMAWTVNDLGTVNRLVEWGVDAIVTDNLALMELLGGGDAEALRLDRYRAEESEAEAGGEEPEDGASDGAEEQRPAETQLGLPDQEPDLDVAVVLGDEAGDERRQGRGDDQPDRPAVLAMRPLGGLVGADRSRLRAAYR